MSGGRHRGSTELRVSHQKELGTTHWYQPRLGNDGVSAEWKGWKRVQSSTQGLDAEQCSSSEVPKSNQLLLSDALAGEPEGVGDLLSVPSCTSAAVCVCLGSVVYTGCKQELPLAVLRLASGCSGWLCETPENELHSPT